MNLFAHGLSPLCMGLFVCAAAALLDMPLLTWPKLRMRVTDNGRVA